LRSHHQPFYITTV